MLNGRLYRITVAPVLLALAIAAFSLSSQPGGYSSTLAPDAFEGQHATAEAERLASAFPERRPGSAGDEALATEVARTLEGLGGTAGGGFSVHVHRFQAQTIDGVHTLTTVVAQRPGSTNEAPILIVAHRDAAARGSAAELSGTAVLLELARVFAARETRRTIVLASTSGGSGGDAGVGSALEATSGPFDAAIALGDVGGARTHQPFVVPYSDAVGSAPLELQRTVAEAITREAGVQPGGTSAIGQYVHLAFPFAPGEQGVLAAAGIPAVLVQVSGERTPSPHEALSSERIEGVGRGVLSAIDAVDTAPDISQQTQTGLFLQHKIFPEWALRLLLAALLLGPALLAVDGLARLRRRRMPVGRWALWTLTCALPFFACALFAYAIGGLGVVPAPAVPGVSSAVVSTSTAAITLAAVALVFVVSWLLRAALLRRLRWDLRPDPDVAGLALLLVLVGACAFAWIFDPFTALLALPALHLWLLLADPELRPRRSASLALVLLGLLPLAMIVVYYAQDLGLGPGMVVWTGIELLAGAHVGFGAALLWSVALGCGAAATMLAMSAAPADILSGGEERVEITIRGPLTYAGPGSLGGTESALRR